MQDRLTCVFPQGQAHFCLSTKPCTCFADIVEVTAKAETHPTAPLHVMAPWLEVLLWLADARWRKLGSAAPVEQVQQLLDCLQGYVALLWTAAPSTPGSQEHGQHKCHQ